ncbi:sensor histidine kinase [Pararcticibacter amylolyticus]|nr:HAMP domain-containing sensor histidine kinase [Pararcticibacter amylolyticus]
MKQPSSILAFGRVISGPSADFALPVRIFHSVLVICMFALAYNIPFNWYVGLPAIALVSGVTLVVVAFVYYLSRFLHYTRVARTIFCISGTSLFVVNYFLNSGIDGPTGFFLILMMVVMVAIVPVRQYWIWVSSTILIALSLHYLQYTRPDLVPYTYASKKDRYIDISSAFLTVVSVILLCFYFIRRRYDMERRDALRNAARMKELDLEKNKLFSIIAHDLRSPLSHIQNFLEMLAEYDLTEKESQQIREELMLSTRRTLEMLNNVLHWSKNQMSGFKIEKDTINILQVLSPQLLLFRDIAAAKGISLDLKIEANLTLAANSDMLQVIVRNLINNAIKFTASGGSITVFAGYVDGQCRITVSDSGNGLPVHLSKEIFSLSISPGLGTANERGTGLGLTLCREYTELLEGRIYFKCDPYSGTTFFVDFPADEKGKEAMQQLETGQHQA